MAAGISVYQANRMLNKLMRGVDYTVPSSYWTALFTHPTSGTFLRNNDVTSAVEVAAAFGYGRIEVRGATGIEWTAPASGLVESNDEIVWNEATGSWGLIYSVALLDTGLGAANVVLYYEFPEEVSIDAPDVFKIPTNLFDVSA